MARPRKNAGTRKASNTASAGAVREKPRPKPKRARMSAPRDCPSQRSSAYRGVTRHRWTGRFEAHLWDKDAWNEPQTKKGRQVYLGAYDDEDAAARAHDLAALKYWGPGTALNFPACAYGEKLKEMEAQPREEYIGSLRRRSSGFSRGVSKFRGVARHHHNGRWEARIGRVLGNKYLYLGTYATQEEAAVAYDIAAIEHRGLNAVTNFDISHYVSWHRRRHRLAEDGVDATEVVPIHPPYDPTEHAPATSYLDETVVAAAAFDAWEQQHQTADPSVTQVPGQVRRSPAHAAATSSSVLELLLQSPKFREKREQVSAAASEPSNASSPPSSPPPLPEQEPEPPQQTESTGGAPARCSFFPDDVQTYFESEDAMSLALAEVDTFLFGDLGAYASPMFQCDLDV